MDNIWIHNGIRRVSTVASIPLLLLTGVAVAGALKTEFRASTVDLGLVLTQPGTVECPGGEPTGLWPFGPPCSPGSRVHVRGALFQYVVNATDPRVSGVQFVVVNGNFDSWTAFGPGSGPMWGTSRIEVAGGGVWEGTWTGKRTVAPNSFEVSLRGVSHGTGGSINGLKLQTEGGFGLTTPSFLNGFILDAPAE